MSKEYAELVNFKVKVTLKTPPGARQGILLAVDPNTKAIMLEETESVSCFPAHSIESIAKASAEASQREMPNLKEYCDRLFNIHPPPMLDSVDNQLKMLQRREGLLAYLNENNIPVEEIDDLLLAAYSVSISPPYGESDCKSSNAIVLNRIKTIVRNYYSQST